MRSAFYLATLLVAALVFVGCEAEEEPYVSPSGQGVAPDVVVNTPTDAVTVNLLIKDELYCCELDEAFNWQTSTYYYDNKVPYLNYELVGSRNICDLGAMNGLGNITTFSNPNPAGECAVIKGHGYIFYLDLVGVVGVSEEVLKDDVLNDYYKNNGLEYYCVWVKDVFENGITVQYVVRKTSVVTNS